MPEFTAFVVVGLSIALVVDLHGERAKVASQWRHTRARSVAFVPHARRVTRSLLMAHPQGDPRA